MKNSLRLSALAVCLLVASRAEAVLTDHLQCFKIKDLADKASYTADVVPGDAAFANLQPGCTVQVPAKLLCVDAAKTNVVPAPAGADAGTQLQKYLCYKAKCAKLEVEADLTDQFGVHPVTTKTTSLLCAPVEGSLPTTTTTTTLPACIDQDGDSYCYSTDDCNDCSASVNPGVVERCDGADNDCDGSTDESDPDLGAACTSSSPGACAAGTNVCTAGSLVCNPLASPSAETCDDVDNDCDGGTDEGVSQACYTGPAGTVNVGACHPGTQTCSAGSFGSCQDQTVPSAETCDNADNDCDGATDEGISQACYTGPGGTANVGACRTGTQFCSAGTFGTCFGEVLPSAEICDNVDNDCDGATDEGISRTCYTGAAGTAGVGVCRAGTQTCSAGSYGACVGQVTPTTESCADSLDNDCDGSTNEGCP